jgi:2-desacetyl-2-hydroxyethyl bacteriochlorophyllide A dehydrogenase
MTLARSFWLEGRSRAVLRRETLPDPGPGWCVVQTLFSAVSPGTERLVALGKVPDGLREEMACPYMGGGFPFPVKYGYSLVGQVIDGPPGLRGKRGHVLHPHQDICVVRAEDVRPLPDGLPPDRAALASNMETAVTAVWDSGVVLGERVLVVGFGIVGALIAQVLGRGPAVEVQVVDRRPERRRLAEAMGFRATGAPGPDPFDLAFDTSGSPAGLQKSIDAVGLEGRVVAVSWFGTEPARLALGGTFHSRRKRILSSQVSRIPGALRQRFDPARRTALVFRLLESPELDRLMGPRIRFAGLPKAYETLVGRPPEGLSPLIVY